MKNTPHKPMIRAGLVVALCVMFTGLAIAFQIILHAGVVYTHLAYVPIVLGGLWWGRRSIWIALYLGGVVLAAHVLGDGARGLSLEMVRTSFFLVVAACIGVLRDRLRDSETALTQSRESYRQLVDKSIAGIFVYRDGTVIFMNGRLTEILGYHRDEIVGMSIWDFIFGADQPKVRKLTETRRTEGVEDLHYECRLLHKNGRIVWADMASSPIHYEGEEAVLVSLYEITRTKEAEAKKQELAAFSRQQEEQLIHSTRLAELGEMAAAIAHELNQPLTGIKNFAGNAVYMIENAAGTMEDVHANLKLISEQVGRASKIITQMRELTRKSEEQLARLDINLILRESVEFLRPQLALSDVEVRLDLAENLPEITGDRLRLEQVFLNLLTNARQAMEDSRERRLTVRTCADSERGRFVVAEITDTGAGFSSEVAGHLFKPFFTTKKAGHGTGLGLSISMNIVKNHKGDIEASGEPGRGATFRVRLPLAESMK